jgi:hypothetical protein
MSASHRGWRYGRTGSLVARRRGEGSKGMRLVCCAVPLCLSVCIAMASLAGSAASAAPAPSRVTQSYWEVASDGGVFTFGNAQFFGSLGGQDLAGPVVGIAATPDGKGYWEVEANGDVFNFGDASPSTQAVHGTIGVVAYSDVSYLEAASDGSVIYQGGTLATYSAGSNFSHDEPIVGIAAAPSNRGLGYWLVGADGGVFSFGSANFFGSMGGKLLNKPIVGIAATADGGGYWLVAADGGIFSFGDADFYGSMGGQPLNKPIVGIAATSDGGGYWEVASDGGIFNYGDAGFSGSMGGKPVNAPITGMAVVP